MGALVRLAHTLDVSLDALVLGGQEARMEQDVRVLAHPRGPQRTLANAYHGSQHQGRRWICIGAMAIPTG